jgi:Na+/H+ antiporter NhaC
MIYKGDSMMGNTKEGRASALLPILVFLLIFLGSGYITGDFYSMPAIAAFLIALLVAFVQNRQLCFADKIRLAAEGVGNENIITMCLIFLAAGAFTGAVKAAGGVDSTVNLGLSILPSNVAVAGLFLIGCFISISMGTSVGTITALAPIAVGISQKTGFSMAICAGAVVGGAMFGDNLSMISDTTIAAVKTQGCEMKDKFRENFLIVLPAAIVTILLFLVLGRNAAFQLKGELTFNIFRVLPYLVVLIGALAGVNVFIVLIAGTVLSLIAGVGTGAFGLGDMFTHVGEGIMGMYDITVISIIVASIVALVKEYGGIDFILSFIRKRISGERGGELGIAALALLVDMCTANNTVAIVMSGPIAKEISDDFGVTSRRSASLLDMFSSMGQGLIPYGAQLLAAATLTGLTPFEIIPYCFYPLLMGVSGLVFIFIKKRTRE